MENTISARMTTLMKSLNMSTNAFAKSIGKSQSAVRLVVEGKTKPSFDVLDAICDKYNVNPTWLLKGSGEMLADSIPPAESVVANDSYLQSYLEKLEEQFKRVMNQLETKDRQIERLMDLLGKLDLGGSTPWEFDRKSELGMAA